MERRMDNRLGERLAIQLAVRLASARSSRTSIGRLRNLSRSGALISGCELQLYSLIDVVLREATIAAYVTRVEDDGAGVEWCEFAPPTVTELLQAELAPSVAPPGPQVQAAAPDLAVAEPLVSFSG
jgi:hypothetical protein